jgi:biofilm protein TabA
MILDHLVNYQRYVDMHPAFAKAFEFLAEMDPEMEGRFELDGDDLYCLVENVKPMGKENRRLEVHQKYIDIQYVVTGKDIMGWESVEEDAPGDLYDPDKDFRLIDTPPLCWVEVPAGYFAVFYPEDAHAPLAGDKVIKKVVIKVKVQV